MNQKGSTTVFFASICIAVLLLVSVCLEGIYLHVGKGKAAGAYMSALMSTQGNYQKELQETYHLFGLDPRYEAKLPKDVKERLQISLEDSKDQFRYEVSQVGLSKGISFDSNQAGLLKYQIREYMKYKLGEDGVEKLTGKLAKQPESRDIKVAKDQLTESEHAAKEQEEMKEEPKEEVEDSKAEKPVPKKEDPRKGFMKLLKTGIVHLVYPKGKEISKAEIQIVYGTKEESEVPKIDFFASDSVKESLDETKTKDYKKNLTTELLGAAYGTTMFHHGASKEKKEGTQYEVEYLICGNSNDEENLAGTLHRMQTIRFLTNRVSLLGDTKRTKEAEALSAAILGVTGLPPLVLLGKELLLAALSYGESILDLRSLVEGKEIPVIKNPSMWQLEFTGLATLTGRRKTVASGLSYENLLQILLLTQSDTSMKYLRMMDMMEKNIKEKVSGFSFAKCYASYDISAKIKLKSFGFAGMRIPLLPFYPLNYKRTVVY